MKKKYIGLACALLLLLGTHTVHSADTWYQTYITKPVSALTQRLANGWQWLRNWWKRTPEEQAFLRASIEANKKREKEQLFVQQNKINQDLKRLDKELESFIKDLKTVVQGTDASMTAGVFNKKYNDSIQNLITRIYQNDSSVPSAIKPLQGLPYNYFLKKDTEKYNYAISPTLWQKIIPYIPQRNPYKTLLENFIEQHVTQDKGTLKIVDINLPLKPELQANARKAAEHACDAFFQQQIEDKIKQLRTTINNNYHTDYFKWVDTPGIFVFYNQKH